MLNVVALMGRLVADPELKHTSSQTPVTTFRIAVDRTFQPKGQDKQTDWIDIVAWRNTADFVTKYFRKGSMIVVQGSIQTRTYTDNNGNKRYVVEILADNVFFGESKHDSAAPAPVRSEAPVPQTAEVLPAFPADGSIDFEEIVDNDTLPF